MPPINKYLHRILIILIFISVSSAAYLFSTPKNSSSSPTASSTNTPVTNTQIEELKPAVLTQQNNTVEKNTSNKSPEQTQPSTPTTSPTIITPTTTETITIKFKIEDKEYEINVKPNTSAYEAMNILQGLGKISFSTKAFSGLGQFIEEINGIKNSPKTGFYWTFYINNEEAKIGISNYVIKPNDLITWKYENK